MSKRRKLLERIRQNPKNVSFEDLRKLLEMYGFIFKRSRGSHCSFQGYVGGQKVPFVVPYNQPLKPVYVRKALALVDQIRLESPEEEDERDDE